ncbi:MAG: FliM/FliN family flagellar motor switch protein [Cyanobacteria bacterium HKST-UBA04]|nr:FliM/FliN family flagellar motor switch protein [Cyanobacteria bacterium HKST-UBA04]
MISGPSNMPMPDAMPDQQAGPGTLPADEPALQETVPGALPGTATATLEGTSQPAQAPPSAPPPNGVLAWPVSSPYSYILPAESLAEQITKTIQTFWHHPMRVKLFSIAHDPHYYWHTQDFYVAQKGLDDNGQLWGQLRLSEGLCQYLIESSLGKAQSEALFTLSAIRHFEVFLLERFSRNLFELMATALLQPPPANTPITEEAQTNLMHLVWVLSPNSRPEELDLGKAVALDEQEYAGNLQSECCMVLTAPQLCLKPQLLPERVYHPLPDSQFIHAHADVRLKVGRSWATLEELQTLEPEDIIILEDSHLSRASVWDPVTGTWLDVTTYLDNPAALSSNTPFNETDEYGANLMNEMTQAPQNIWDTLNVEVTATFNPVRLPLKNLRDMEQGLVLEVADLMDNKLYVQVEGHTVAWGELIVVGERFGIRVQGIQDTIDPTEAQVRAEQAARQRSLQGQGAGGMGDPMMAQAGVDPNAAAMGDVNAQAVNASVDEFGETQFNEGENFDDPAFDDFDNEEDWS